MKKLTLATIAIALATFAAVGVLANSEALCCESCGTKATLSSKEGDATSLQPKDPGPRCALSPTELEGRISRLEEISKGVLERKELDDGYGFRFAPDAKWLHALAEIILLESECCTFFGFTIIAEPNGGPLWLHMTGSPEVKRFLETQLGLLNG